MFKCFDENIKEIGYWIFKIFKQRINRYPRFFELLTYFFYQKNNFSIGAAAKLHKKLFQQTKNTPK